MAEGLEGTGRSGRRPRFEPVPGVVLALLVLLVILLVSPRGDFPLNDDWVYYRTVENILDEGRFSPHPFAQSLFVLQGYWGALWASLFGLSFSTLRFSTFVLAFLGAWMTASTARRAGASQRASLLAGAALLFSPVYLNLSYTFMTDVPFTALVALSVYWYTRAWDGVGKRDGRFVLAATVVASLSFLIRQFGMLPTLAFTAVYVLYCWKNPGKSAWYIGAALGLPWLVVVLASSSLPVLSAEGGQSADWRLLGRGVFGVGCNALQWLIVAGIYLSLFALPFVFALLMSSLARLRPVRRGYLFGFAVLAIVCVYVAVTGRPGRMPYLSNVLYDLGVGPLTLSGLWEGREIYRPVRWGAWWWIPTALGLCGTVCWIWCSGTVFRILARPPRSVPAKRYRELFLVLNTALFVMALFNPWMQLRFDRYLLPAMPSFLALAAVWTSPLLRRPIVASISAAFFVLAAGFSVVCLQDYMAWNRARWDALHSLMEHRSLPPEEIDGGYEFNGLFTSDGYIEQYGRSAFAMQGPIGHWVVEDDFAVAFTPRADFQVLERWPYFSWLGFEERAIYTLRRVRESEWPPR
jgi:hypothetical protein